MVGYKHEVKIKEFCSSINLNFGIIGETLDIGWNIKWNVGNSNGYPKQSNRF